MVVYHLTVKNCTRAGGRKCRVGTVQEDEHALIAEALSCSGVLSMTVGGGTWSVQELSESVLVDHDTSLP